MKLFTNVAISIHIALATAQKCEQFPVIDLGYAKHAPTVVNSTSLHNISYATYANIRFVQPPTGANRFRKPQLPNPVNETVQDGVVGQNATDCVIYIPPWLPIAPGVNGTGWGSEDCLFLDVKVPEGLQGQKVPVLHWLYGGGFTFGSKNDWAGNPAGLFQDMPPDQKFIIVSSNYRLGAFGWMSSQTEPDMDANLGIWDSLAALEWTKEYISYFGGDPDDITVIGESSGGGIVQHLITAFDGEADMPFSKAILTSPGYRPHVNRSEGMTNIYNAFLNATNCTDVACLRQLPTEALEQAQIDLYDIPSSGWLGPDIGYGPIIDGDLVTDTPDRLLLRGRWNKNVKKVLTANMALDGLGGTVTTPTTWEEQLGYYMTSPTPEAVKLAQQVFGANLTTGAIAFNKAAIYACHAYFTAAAFRDSSSSSAYRYEMSISPATHGQDQFYYFFVDEEAAGMSVSEPDVARTMQEYFRSFIFEGRMGGGGCDGDGNVTTHWPAYGREERWMNITTEGFEVVYGEETQRTQCEALLSMINDPANGF